MKKTVVTVFVAVITVCSCALNTFNRDVYKVWECGDNVTCTLNETLFTITGKGAMTNYRSSEYVPWRTFRSSITNVTIENGVTTIGDNTFYHFESIESVIIPDSVERIGGHAFYYCSKMKNVVIPNSVKSIESKAFMDCLGLLGVTIPDSVTSIGDYAFYDCYSFTSLTIPDSVTSIGSLAFSGLIRFKGTVLTIPKNVVTIGGAPFSFIHQLKAIEVSEDNPHFVSVNGVLFDKNCTRLIQFPQAMDNETYSIPGSVKVIGEYAFNSCHNLTKVIIPDGVTTIEEAAFRGCLNITNVTIPDSVISIGKDAFWLGEHLSSIYYQGLHSFNTTNAFDLSRSVRDVCVPPDYAYDTFCEKNVTRSTENCKEFERLFDHCYKGAFIDDKFVQQKRKNATDYEGRTIGCIVYACDNETGPVSPVKICGAPPECHEGEGTCDEETGKCEFKKKNGWKELVSQENQCHEVVCDGNAWLLRKMDNASEWEKRTNACAVYYCDNETGLVSWSNCNSTDTAKRICVEGLCIDSDEQTNQEGKVIVEIELTDARLEEMNVSALVETLSALCNISSDSLKIGYETDDRGNVLRMIVLVDEESTADIIANTLTEMKKDNCSYGVLCKTKRAFVINKNDVLSKTTRTKAGIIVVFLASVLGMMMIEAS